MHMSRLCKGQGYALVCQYHSLLLGNIVDLYEQDMGRNEKVVHISNGT